MYKPPYQYKIEYLSDQRIDCTANVFPNPNNYRPGRQFS